MGGFDQWGATAGSIADAHGIDRSVFFGLIDAESSWNPNATPGTTSAWGFTQLLKGTANDLHVNRFDPVQNMNGGASYLSSLLKHYGGDYTKALAAYHDGTGALGQHGGFEYAKTVLGKAQGYLQKGAHLLGLNPTTAAMNAIVPGSGVIAGALGVGGGGPSWFDELKDWILGAGFFKRLALGLLAFIIIAAGFALMRGQTISQTIMPKKG